MNRNFVTLVLAALVAVVACRKEDAGSPLGTTYATIARPAVWRVVPRTQAETLGLEPGDLIVAYGAEPVKTTEELVQLQFRLAGSQDPIPLTVLRGDAELKLDANPGMLGVLPVAERYPGGLAVAVKDMLDHYGVTADYDWLAALTGESFAFAARSDGCRGAWPNGLAGAYIEGLTQYYGLTFRSLFNADAAAARPADKLQQEALTAIRDRLSRGKPLLVSGTWAGCNGRTWGIATRWSPDDSLVHGYMPGSAGEVALNGLFDEAYEVGHRPSAGTDPADLLTTVLTQALELGQAYADTGWQTGIVAYDLWIRSLDSVPFCPVCPDSGRACFDRLVWTLLANKESANRFLQDMREALPDQAELLEQVIAQNSTVIAKLTGIVQSGIVPGTMQSQQKLARAVNEVQLIEAELIRAYEGLIGEL